MKRQERSAEPARLFGGLEEQMIATCDTGLWEHFAHGADIGVRGKGSTKEEAFEQAGLAMMAVMTNPKLVRPEQRVEVRCEAPNDDLLLLDWLNALVYEVACRNMIFSKFKVAIFGHQLTGQLWGENVDVPRHEPAAEVKGATCTELRVRPENHGWIAQCVVDV